MTRARKNMFLSAVLLHCFTITFGEHLWSQQDLVYDASWLDDVGEFGDWRRCVGTNFAQEKSFVCVPFCHKSTCIVHVHAFCTSWVRIPGFYWRLPLTMSLCTESTSYTSANIPYIVEDLSAAESCMHSTRHKNKLESYFSACKHSCSDQQKESEARYVQT